MRLLSTIHLFLVIKNTKDCYCFVLVSFVIFYCVGFNFAFRRISRFLTQLSNSTSIRLCVHRNNSIHPPNLCYCFLFLVFTCFFIHSVSEKLTRLKVSKTMSLLHGDRGNNSAKWKWFGINKMLVITAAQHRLWQKKNNKCTKNSNKWSDLNELV